MTEKIEKFGEGHFRYRNYRLMFSESGELCHVSPNGGFSYRNLGGLPTIQDAARFVDLLLDEGEEAAEAFREKSYGRYVEEKMAARRKAMEDPAFGTIR